MLRDDKDMKFGLQELTDLLKEGQVGSQQAGHVSGSSLSVTVGHLDGTHSEVRADSSPLVT